MTFSKICKKNQKKYSHWDTLFRSSSTESAISYKICSWGYDSTNKDSKDLKCYDGENVAHATCNGASGWNGIVYRIWE